MESKSNSKRKNNWIIVLIGIICLVVAFVLILLFFMQGKKTSSNSGGSTESMQSMVCSAGNVAYPYFKYDNSKSKSIEITSTFNEEKLDSIMLIYTLDYDSAEEAERSNVENHTSLAKQLQEDSLSVDEFGANYSVLGKSLQLNLFAKANKLTGITAKYFLIDNTSGSHKMDTLMKMYNAKGLDCVLKK